MLICGSFMLGRLFDFIFAHFLFNGVLYFSLKNLFCGKSFFLLISVRFIFTEFFQGKRKYRGSERKSLKALIRGNGLSKG